MRAEPGAGEDFRVGACVSKTWIDGRRVAVRGEGTLDRVHPRPGAAYGHDGFPWERLEHAQGGKCSATDDLASLLAARADVNPAPSEALLNNMAASLGAGRTCCDGPGSVGRCGREDEACGRYRHHGDGYETLHDQFLRFIEPIFEADFKPCSYGFRPKRRAHGAIAEIHYLNSGSREFRWVLEYDIKACFDEIDHTALMDRFRARIKDKRICALVKAFLKSGILNELGDREESFTGTPQGGGATRGRTFMSGSRWLEVRLMPRT
jgi:hypothetical protein